MSAGLVIVKLGGSVITRKREEARLRPKLLDRLARELAESGNPSLIVLHGAGSFGHPMAARFGLAQPPEVGSEKRRSRGAALVAADVRRLDLAVLTALAKAGASPFSLPPYPIAENDRGRLAALDSGAFARALESGALPVSFGDVVVDRSWGFSILSADTIALELARKLQAHRVIFVSDVEGIYELGPPGRRTTVPLVTPDLVARLRPTSKGPDVTGGIRAKAETMLAIAEGGCDAGLISGLRNGTLLRALRGDAVYGSWAKAASR